MFPVPRKIKFAVVGMLLCGVGVFVLVNFTNICLLEAVTLDGKQVENFDRKYGLNPKTDVLDQPLDSLSDALLAKKGIVKVDIDYNVPHGIEIRTNQFTPSCFILDSENERLLGLSDEGRVVTIPEQQQNWEHPTLVNVKVGHLYDHCPDPRVDILMPQLRRLEGGHVDLYRLITEVDFANSDYLIVTVSGVPFKLRVSADRFADQMDEFIEFIEKFTPDLTRTKFVDLRFDDMIIRTGESR